MKYLSEYIDYVTKLGYNLEYTEFLDNDQVYLVFKNDDKEVTISAEGDQKDYSTCVVTSATLSSLLTPERNFFSNVGYNICLSNNSDYHTHRLSLFEKCIDLQLNSIVGHELFITKKHVENLEWVNKVLYPILRECDYKMAYSSIFSIEEKEDSDLTIQFKHYNESEQSQGIIVSTDCITGELHIFPKELQLYGKSKEEIWDNLVEYWKNSSIPSRYEYLYTEGQTKNSFKELRNELDKKRYEN